MSQPIKGETQVAFITRCMQEQDGVKSYPDKFERYEVCQRVWETHKREAMTAYVKSLKKWNTQFLTWVKTWPLIVAPYRTN
jgi:hypothetical protein